MNAWEKAQRLLESLQEDDDGLYMTKRSNYADSFSLSDDEYKDLLGAAQKGKARLDVFSAIDDKPLASLDAKEIILSLMKMKPSLNPTKKGSADYWAAKIPPSSRAKSKTMSKPKPGAN